MGVDGPQFLGRNSDMKFPISFLTFLLITSTGFATTPEAVKKCKAELKKTQEVCLNSYFCVRDYLVVSGMGEHIIDTGSSVVCRGDKSLDLLGKSDKSDKNKPTTKRKKKIRF